MNVVQKRRLVRRRREQESRGGKAARSVLIGVLSLGVLGTLAFAGGLGVVFAVYQHYSAGYVPIDQKIKQSNVGLTEIYDRGGPQDGVLLGQLTNSDAQLLNPVKLDQISQYMIDATVSTEDNSFWSNPGVNINGLIRAGIEFVLSGGNTSAGTGGSSITQQLVKNTYICPSVGGDPSVVQKCAEQGAARTISRKLKEIAYSLQLEHDFSKQEVLQYYLNQISYADRYIGIQAAAQGYFHKDASQLDLAEAATLAGVPAAPTTYHPRLNCLRDDTGQCIVDPATGTTTLAGAAKTRQEEVLDLMVVHGRITKQQADAAKAEVVRVYPAASDIKAAAFIDDQVEPRLVRMCNAGLLPKLPGATDCQSSVHAAGYKVTTTLDYAETSKAEELIRQEIAEGLSKNSNAYDAAIVTIEPSTGQVIVYAPNRDPSYVSDPRVAGDIDELVEINQPGSSFKPVVYLNWLDTLGKNPYNIIWDTSPLNVDGTSIVDPRADGGNEGLITMRAAMGGSQNVPAFRAAQEGGIDNVIAMAKKLGITTLDQHFDPTFRDHSSVVYGASIATGGANIRAIDMAYMNATLANMGEMVGVPTLAQTVQLKDLKSLATSTGADYDLALKQKQEFQLGNIRIPGTRPLDPVVVLQVQDSDGKVLYQEGPDLQKKQVVNAGSVWLLQSVMTDCTARFIIWYCGSSNTDNDLDAFMTDGTKIPEGIKTGTQQGPLSAVDTLATWMNGYSRYAATSVWVGNANKELVHDGTRWNYASANTTTTLFKTWMGMYHDYLQSKGVFKEPADFSSLKPPNVAMESFKTPSTDRVLPDKGSCDQTVTVWVRTDIAPYYDCAPADIDSRNGLLATDQTPPQFRLPQEFVKLPSFMPETAVALAQARNIPLAPTEKSNGSVAVAITNLSNGKTITSSTDVVGSVNPSSLKNWKLEIGLGSAPANWKTIGSGTGKVDNGVLGRLDLTGLANGVYTVRLSTDDGTGLSTTVLINIQHGAGNPFIPGQGGLPSPTAYPTPFSLGSQPN